MAAPFRLLAWSKSVQPVTSTAIASAALGNVRVFRREFVTAFAVCHRLVSSFDHKRNYSSEDVGLAGDRLKMVRIDATPYPAEMIELHSFRNRTSGQFISNDVGFAYFPSIADVLANAAISGG